MAKADLAFMNRSRKDAKAMADGDAPRKKATTTKGKQITKKTTKGKK